MTKGPAVLAFAIAFAILAPHPAPAQVVVQPKEIDDLFANPGMGWQTFHMFADHDKALSGLPSAAAYFRWYWDELEPAEGKIDFEKIDGLLARARKAGQRLSFRVMCVGTDERLMYVPKWLREKGCKGFEYQYAKRGPTYWAPDFEDPLFQKAHVRLIEELGKRYDGHPDIDTVDIGSVGLWGEWHMSDTGVKMPEPETRLRIVEAWCKAFPRPPRVMLIGDLEPLIHAVRAGCGWRADCLGDLGGFSKTWNHMDHLYRQQIQKAQAGDAWKKAPVAFESCWDMRRWTKEGWSVRAIFDYALDMHASLINNKSAPLPEGSRPEVERFLRKLGYRLVLRSLRHPASVARGAPAPVVMTWENVGVAPPYRDFVLGLRLAGEDRTKAVVIAGKTSVKGWLPGKVEASETLAVPADLPPGTYDLSVAVLDPAMKQPALRLAIEGRGEDGWYPVGRIDVR
jgi:hypothetical protein